jgi:hypothetical protein
MQFVTALAKLFCDRIPDAFLNCSDLGDGLFAMWKLQMQQHEAVPLCSFSPGNNIIVTVCVVLSNVACHSFRFSINLLGKNSRVASCTSNNKRQLAFLYVEYMHPSLLTVDPPRIHWAHCEFPLIV